MDAIAAKRSEKIAAKERKSRKSGSQLNAVKRKELIDAKERKAKARLRIAARRREANEILGEKLAAEERKAKERLAAKRYEAEEMLLTEKLAAQERKAKQRLASKRREAKEILVEKERAANARIVEKEQAAKARIAAMEREANGRIFARQREAVARLASLEHEANVRLAISERGPSGATSKYAKITLTLRGEDEELVDEDAENSPCLLCLVNKATVASVCCGKLALCMGCTRGLYQGKRAGVKKCLNCRAKVHHCIRIS